MARLTKALETIAIILLREETKIQELDTKSITVTEVRMSPDLKTAKIFVIPLGGKDKEKHNYHSYNVLWKMQILII